MDGYADAVIDNPQLYRAVDIYEKWFHWTTNCNTAVTLYRGIHDDTVTMHVAKDLYELYDDDG